SSFEEDRRPGVLGAVADEMHPASADVDHLSTHLQGTCCSHEHSPNRDIGQNRQRNASQDLGKPLHVQDLSAGHVDSTTAKPSLAAPSAQDQSALTMPSTIFF